MARCVYCGLKNHTSRNCRYGVSKCFTCNTFGHISTNCTEKYNVFYNCNGLGHMSRDCPFDDVKSGDKEQPQSGKVIKDLRDILSTKMRNEKSKTGNQRLASVINCMNNGAENHSTRKLPSVKNYRSRSRSRSPRQLKSSGKRHTSRRSRSRSLKSGTSRSTQSQRISNSPRERRSPGRSHFFRKRRSPHELRSPRRSRSRSNGRTTKTSRIPHRNASPKYNNNDMLPSYGKWRSTKPPKVKRSMSPSASGLTSRSTPATILELTNINAPVRRRIKTVSSASELNDDEPLTVISVLSLLTALEDILGILGPKVIELMFKAKKMDLTEENSSHRLLDDDDHCILFQTIQVKLNGLSGAGLVEVNKVHAVQKAIRNMTTLVHQANERRKASTQQGVFIRRRKTPSPPIKEFDRQKTPSSLAAALMLSSKCCKTEEYTS